jgi:hypothetical protein
MLLIDTDIGLWAGVLVLGVVAATVVAATLASTLGAVVTIFGVAVVVALVLYYIGIRADSWLSGQSRRGY